MIKILIADDNYEFVKTIFNSITNSKINNLEIVKISSNGEEALNHILMQSIDIVLLDLQMPRMNRIRIIRKN